MPQLLSFPRLYPVSAVIYCNISGGCQKNKWEEQTKPTVHRADDCLLIKTVNDSWSTFESSFSYFEPLQLSYFWKLKDWAQIPSAVYWNRKIWWTETHQPIKNLNQQQLQDSTWHLRKGQCTLLSLYALYSGLILLYLE